MPTPDVSYLPVPYIYRSKGLIARDTSDQSPEYFYLNMLNCLERMESSMSSRYGTEIINRDPAGTVNGRNYFFTSPVITLARMLFQGQSYRYAATAAGQLFRRTGDSQGPYSQIYSSLSGEPFGWVTTSCFASSQNYLFIFDQAVSIKDSGVGTPELIGIDPSPYTANAQPYSPLLTLVDNFAPTNSYTTSGFSGAFSYDIITTLMPFGGFQVTDFPEFIQASYEVAGGDATAAASTPSAPTDTGTFTCAPFIPAGVSGAPATLTVTLSGSFNITRLGTGELQIQYSINSGVTWTSFYSVSSTDVSEVIADTPVTVSIYGLSNIDTLIIRLVATASVRTPAFGQSIVYATGTIANVFVSVNPQGLFGLMTNGMLSLLPGGATINVPIVSITSITQVTGLYTQLQVVTRPHGLTGIVNIAVYGSSNNLCDGFYTATVVNATTITVPFISAVLLSATAGFLMGGASAGPEECVLQNLYSTPYPSQLSAWGFYQQVGLATTEFPVSCWVGTVPTNSTATVGNTISLDLSVAGEVTSDDLIVCTLAVGDPASLSNIRLQFDVNDSNYTASYYYKDISPAYYQQGVQQLEDAYTTTEQQIFADTLGLITGAPPDTTTAQLQPANLSTGQGAWVAALLRRGDFVAVGTAGQSGLDWSNITGWQIVVTTSTVGSSTVSVNGIYLQWGYGPSSFGGIGYDYRYTYLNNNTLTESNACPPQEFDPTFGYLASLVSPFYLRQAAQVTGYYSSDPQVTHVRIYRKGGIANQNWYQIDQIPNVYTAASPGFVYKDVVADAALEQALPLQLDNDPPVTSTLPVPLSTTLQSATTSPGNTYYTLFAPQLVQMSATGAGASFTFVPDQIAEVGYAQNLEEVRVISGGTGQFTGIFRLKHNAGEPVQVYALPRQPCSLAAIAYQQNWLAGDKNNTHYLYFSKPGYPESFPPENYIPVGAAGQDITAVVNWRGTLFVKTLVTWWQIVGGANPYPQPTGCAHGGPAREGWTEVDSSIWFRSSDGLRDFFGASARYMSLNVEFIYRQNPATPLPLADPTQASQDVMAFYNNDVFTSYISLDAGIRFRLIWSTVYQRFRIDDIAATAMLWERDTNTFLVARQLRPNQGGTGLIYQQAQTNTLPTPDEDFSGSWTSAIGMLVRMTPGTVLNNFSVFQSGGDNLFLTFYTSAFAQIRTIDMSTLTLTPTVSAPIGTAWMTITATGATPTSSHVVACDIDGVPALSYAQSPGSGTSLSTVFAISGSTNSAYPLAAVSPGDVFNNFILSQPAHGFTLVFYTATMEVIASIDMTTVTTFAAPLGSAFWSVQVAGSAAGGYSAVYSVTSVSSVGAYAIVQDQVTTQDYDDNGWVAGQLTQAAININLQPVFQDLGKPHFPKQWNVLEDDVNTAGQDLITFLQFDADAEDATEIIPTPNPASTTTRQKLERKITPLGADPAPPTAAGQPGYRMSWIHQMAVISAPTFYQENIYAAVLADARTSFDTYWLKFGTDQSKIVKQGYFDYTATGPLTVSLFADGSMIPYWTFTLPAEPGRLSVRSLFLKKKPRLWRMIINSAASQPFQLWSPVTCEWKPIREGSTWAVAELVG